MRLTVNDAEHDVDDADQDTPLLWVLRDVLGLTGTKFGCGAGFCAACTVLIDGRNVKSCQTAVGRAVDRQITTVEGAQGPVADAVRDAWFQTNVVQCGYCQPGQTLAAMALLGANPAPDDAAIGKWMNGNLCRCGTYPRIREAIHTAASTLAAGKAPPPLTVHPEPQTAPLTDADAADPIHPYIRVHDDGTVVVQASQLEMGQGIHTGLATIVAEEMDADFASVRVVNAANGRHGGRDVYGNPELGGALQITGASNSMQGYWKSYRIVAAQARARLISAAAAAWGVPAAEIEVEAGVLLHPSGAQGTFAEFAARAEAMPVPEGVTPKSRDRYTLIGREGRLRVDAAAKIVGATTYTIDIALPGLVTAVVLHPSVFGARPGQIDDAAALALPGVLAVVPLPEGVAVVGETPHDAYRGLLALQVTWDFTDAERRSSEELFAEHRRVIETGEAAVLVRDEGGARAVLASAAYTIDALYEVPHLAHAPMEPNNAVCRMRDDGVLEVWASSESPEYTRTAAAEAAGIDADQVQVHVPLAGGSFGLHYSTTNGKDPTIEVARIGRALGWKHPVKVQSLREEEFKIGQFRAMAVHRVRAGADDAGRLTAVHHHIAAQPTSVNLPFVRDVMFTNNVDFFSTTGVADHPYTYPAFTLESSNVATGVPTMTWRSVGNSHSEFARECALDELAIAAGRDPVELRRELLVDDPRTLRAMEIAVASGGWGEPPTEGRARGITTSGFLGHSAQLTEISLDERGRIGIDRIVFALDCGIVVNPDLVRAQVEGGLLYALSAAIWGEVTLGEGGVIETQNFDRYRVMRMQSVPRIEIHLIDSDEPPTGVGEVSVPTAAPALANAVAALTGTRIRRLPLSKSIAFH